MSDECPHKFPPGYPDCCYPDKPQEPTKDATHAELMQERAIKILYDFGLYDGSGHVVDAVLVTAYRLNAALGRDSEETGITATVQALRERVAELEKHGAVASRGMRRFHKAANAEAEQRKALEVELSAAREREERLRRVLDKHLGDGAAAHARIYCPALVLDIQAALSDAPKPEQP